MSQEGMEIRSEGNQELLILIIKALSNYITKKSEPAPVVVQPAIAVALSSPAINAEVGEEQSDYVPVNGNGRRFTSIAANPYTGALHYVYYPTYYPVVG